MSTNINAIFQAILTLTDNTLPNAPYTNNIDLQNPTLVGTQVLNESFLQCPVSPGVTLSYSFNAYLVLVWNRSLTNNLQVNGSVVSGPGVQEIAVLGPGDVFVYMAPSKLIGYNPNGITLIGISTTVPATVIVAG